MFFVYDVFIRLLSFGMYIFSFFNDKIKKGIEGRRESFSKIQTNFSEKDKIIWMHAASLGEFYQGLPILEGLNEKYLKYKILVTFFSPSGYENVINKENKMNIVFCYLPFDKKKIINKFVNYMDIAIFFTVKYDFWYRLLEKLKSNNIPVYVISALFYKEQSFFKFLGKFFVSQLRKNVNIFFHQTENSLNLAKSIGLENSVFSGDTRFDKVKQNVENFTQIPFIEEFCNHKKVLVVGSSWQAEENLIIKFINSNAEIKVILAPHDVSRAYKIRRRFGEKAILYSDLSEKNFNKFQVLIINNIGLLSRLYYYADVVIVGGGFHSKGLHNILEAAVYSKPVIFGDKFRKNPEADLLIKEGGAKSFSCEEDAISFLKKIFFSEELINEMSENSKKFFSIQPNAKEIVLNKICI